MENQNNNLQFYSNFVLFKTPDGKVNIDVFIKEETVWLNQKQYPFCLRKTEV